MVAVAAAAVRSRAGSLDAADTADAVRSRALSGGGGGGGGDRDRSSAARAAAPGGEAAGSAQAQRALGPSELWSVAAKKGAEAAVAPAPAAPPPPQPSALPGWALPAAGVAAVAAAGVGAKYVLDRPSRPFTEAGVGGTVGAEYDAWTEEGILEYYWGDHIHLGYYTEEERAKGYLKKDFKGAKFDFVDRMLEWSGALDADTPPAKVLDVGCGIGGTTRHLAKRFSADTTQLTGITLSPKQVERATGLAKEQGLDHAQFRVMNALDMEFEDDTFDLVWACESGEHMPDKKAYVEEMARVLKPGGTIVIATWCQREETPETPFTKDEEEQLRFLYEEWAHPYFISIEEYVRLMDGTGKLESVGSANWVAETIDSWRHSIWVGVFDPWPVVFAGPRMWYKVVREIVTLERMHRAFDKDLMTYGMMKGKKAVKAPSPTEDAAEVPAGASA